MFNFSQSFIENAAAFNNGAGFGRISMNLHQVIDEIVATNACACSSVSTLSVVMA